MSSIIKQIDIGTWQGISIERAVRTTVLIRTGVAAGRGLKIHSCHVPLVGGRVSRESLAMLATSLSNNV